MGGTVMTPRERVLAALRGQPVDSVAWLPRLDLWYYANRYRGTLPGEWEGASLLDIVDDLGVGYHAVIPDFLNTESPDDSCDRAIGIEHVPNQPYQVRFRNTKREVRREGDEIRVTYHTPEGPLTARLRYTEQMRRDGVTLMQVVERVVKSLDDYDRVAALFEDIEVFPDDTRYKALSEEVGQRGPVVAYGNVAASPVHHLLKELVPYDMFYYNLHDCPAVIERAAERMQGYFDQVLEACLAGSAEIVLFGANYDVSLTPPAVFEPHILPTLTQWADRLHSAGKMLLTHTDGENDGLCDLYLQAGVDVADSVCPAPMTRLTIDQYRESFGEAIAIWGGICSISVLPTSFSDEQFERHIDEALQAAGDGRGIVLSLADTTPPEASLERIRYIGRRVEAIRSMGVSSEEQST